MSSTVDQIKQKISIVDLIGSYLTLEKAGTNFKAKCPFHNEKTPSFFVSPARGSFYCFGCGEKGDIFTFVEKFESQDFRGALKILADRAGVEIQYESKAAKSERDRLFEILETATLFFQRKLVDNKEALAYLQERGLKGKNMALWRLGFAPHEWRSLHDYLASRGWSTRDMERAGLIKKSEKGFYDRFRSRIIFPIADSSGRIVGFSGRIFGTDDEAKYLNSPETELFNKSELLYGFDKAKLEIRRRGAAVLVEGQMDLLMAHQADTLNTVASSGTALTMNHLRILKRLTNTIILSFDSDTAGQAATGRSAKEALSLGMEVKAALLPHGKDPADLIKADSKAWIEAIEHPVHIIEYEFKKLEKENKDSRELGRLIQKIILPYIAALESAIEKSHFIRDIAKRSGIKEEALWEDLKKTPAGSTVSEDGAHKEKQKVARIDYLERRLVGLIHWFRARGETERAQSLEERFQAILDKQEFENLTAALKEHTNELLLEAEIYFEKRTDVEKEIDVLFAEFTRDHIKKEFAKTVEALAKAEGRKENEKASELLKKLHELSAKMGT